jgi:hypothetical protein
MQQTPSALCARRSNKLDRVIHRPATEEEDAMKEVTARSRNHRRIEHVGWWRQATSGEEDRCASPLSHPGHRRAANALNTLYRAHEVVQRDWWSATHCCMRVPERKPIMMPWFRLPWRGAIDSLVMGANRPGEGWGENAARVRFMFSGRDHRPRDGPSGRVLQHVVLGTLWEYKVGNISII